MFYLYYGDDEFSREEALTALKEAVGPEDLRDINVTELDGREATLDQVIALSSTVPFMTPRRLVAVRRLVSRFESRRASGGSVGREPPDDASSWDRMVGYVAELPESTDLVLVDGRLSPSNSLLKKLQTVATTRTFPIPAGNQLRSWIRDRAVQKEVQIEPEAIEALADLIGGDLRVINGELDKLALYAHDRSITEDDVEALVSYAREASIFVAVDAVVEGRPEVALRALRSLLDSGQSPTYLMAMLARQIRLLLVAKDLKERGFSGPEIGRRLRLIGYPLQKTLDQETMFTAEGLVEVHRMLVETDLNTKTGVMEEEPAIELLVTELATSAPRSRSWR